MKRFLLLPLLFCMCSTPKPIVFLDAGHGGTDNGLVVQGILEKDINLDLALMVSSILIEHKYDAVLVRSRDTTMTLKERTDFVKRNYRSWFDTFISIHQNSARVDVREETIVFTKNNYSIDDIKLAINIKVQFIKNPLPFFKTQYVGSSDFAVLNSNPVTSVIVEVNRFNKPYREWISKDVNQWEVAKRIANGVMEYYK